jgi:hypothetical protein
MESVERRDTCSAHAVEGAGWGCVQDPEEEQAIGKGDEEGGKGATLCGETDPLRQTYHFGRRAGPFYIFGSVFLPSL